MADRLNVTTEALRHAYQAHEAFAPGSLDAPVSSSDDRGAADLLGADDSALDRAVDMDAVRLHWDELPVPQQKILLMRFYGNMTQAQVADKLSCSQMHVSRLQSRALAFLRKRAHRRLAPGRERRRHTGSPGTRTSRLVGRHNSQAYGLVGGIEVTVSGVPASSDDGSSGTGAFHGTDRAVDRSRAGSGRRFGGRGRRHALRKPAAR